MLWLTESADGERQQFETQCSGPPEVPDNELLATLVAELRVDFARDHVVRFAVAYPGDVFDFAPGPLRNPLERKREVIAIEVHNAADIHARAHREIYRLTRRTPALGPLSRPERIAADTRYGTLLECAMA